MSTPTTSVPPQAAVTRRVRVTRFAGPEAIEVAEGDPPVPGPGQALVAVQASSATTSDSIVRRGLNPYMGDLEPPFTLGYDLVGVVRALGPDAGELEAGDRVVAITRWGANADAVVLPAGELTRVHGRVDAALVEPMVMTGATAAAMVRQIGDVHAGQVVYVQGASGGVGTLAVQAARLVGATVIASASPGKHAELRRLGAEVLDYRDPDLVQQILRLAPGGVQFAFDAGGGDGIARAGDSLADGGLLVSFGFAEASRRAAGRSPEVMAATGKVFAAAGEALAAINASPHGLRAVQFDITRLRAENPDGYASDLTWLLDHIEAGRLVPVVRAVRLEDIRAAHRALDAGEVTGRLVLDHRLPR